MLIPQGDKSNLNTLEPGCCFSLLVVLHGFDVRCPGMESNFGLFQFEPRLCRPSFGVKIRGSKPEKPGFHLASCNMQLLANYTKYYTVAVFTRKSLIYMGF
jgi:hypothetical protein